MRKSLCVVAMLVVALVSPATADPGGSDIVATAATGVSFTTGLGTQVGPSFVDLATDGSAWVKFIWFKDALTDRADSTQIARKLVIQLRDYTPPRSIYFPSGPDSARVVPVTATEVVITR